jgi:hypothetical protein
MSFDAHIWLQEPDVGTPFIPLKGPLLGPERS